VLDNGRELYKRLSTMGAHLAKVGAAIERASSAYNDTIGSMERQVLPQARRFAALQEIDKQIELQVVEAEPRAITAAELTEDE